MTNQNPELNRSWKQGWALLISGIVLMTIGLGIRAFAPNLWVNVKVVIALGLVVTGCAVGVLTRAAVLRRNPDTARQVLISERDERTRAIRLRAGNAAFNFSMGFSALVLIIYSYLSRGSAAPVSGDLIWAVLAFMVLAPLAVYIVALVHFDSRM